MGEEEKKEISIFRKLLSLYLYVFKLFAKFVKTRK